MRWVFVVLVWVYEFIYAIFYILWEWKLSVCGPKGWDISCNDIVIIIMMIVEEVYKKKEEAYKTKKKTVRIDKVGNKQQWRIDNTR